MNPKAKNKKLDGAPSDAFLLLTRVLAVIAFVLAGYLAKVSLTGGAIAGCGPDSGCDQVLHSRWGYWFGIPVSLLAVLLYAAMFGLLWRLSPNRSVETQRRCWMLLFPPGTRHI